MEGRKGKRTKCVGPYNPNGLLLRLVLSSCSCRTPIPLRTPSLPLANPGGTLLGAAHPPNPPAVALGALPCSILSSHPPSTFPAAGTSPSSSLSTAKASSPARRSVGGTTTEGRGRRKAGWGTSGVAEEEEEEGGDSVREATKGSVRAERGEGEPSSRHQWASPCSVPRPVVVVVDEAAASGGRRSGVAHLGAAEVVVDAVAIVA